MGKPYKSANIQNPSVAATTSFSALIAFDNNEFITTNVDLNLKAIHRF